MRVIMPVLLLNEDLITLTKSAVDSIRKAGDVHLIIIDNASPVGGGLLRELADTYILNKENLGYAHATNQGLKLCDKGELVAVANNDIRISEGWDKIAEEILKDTKVGSVHFRMIPYDQPFNPGNDVWKSGKERWCTSSMFLVRNVQLYDENFFNSYDDWSYWYEMRKRGYTTAYTNKVEYQHMDSSTVQLMPNREENDIKNREYFKKKWGGYAEDLFEKDFPGELSKPWKPFP